MAFVSGCGDEGLVRSITPLENAPAAPSWMPDALTIDELVFPYAAKQCVGLHDVRGQTFVLSSCEVLYQSRRVLQSEEKNRWVRIANGNTPQHATHWTHDGIPQFLYIFLHFDTEADYQRFSVGTHATVRVTLTDAFSIGKNTWELKLTYPSQAESSPIESRSIESITRTGENSLRFIAAAAAGYFYSGRTQLDVFTLTGIAYGKNGLTLRVENGFPITPERIVLTQASAPTRENRFGRRITFTPTNVVYIGNYAYIFHSTLSREQSNDLRWIGEDIKVGDIFHLYVYDY